MNITIEYIFINPELNEKRNIINITSKDYIEKNGNSYWKRLQHIHNIRFFDENKEQRKNNTTKRGVKRTIIASNVRYYDRILSNKKNLII